MSDRFYSNFAIGLGPFLLQGAEAHHLAVVRRFRAGDTITLFNGDGHEYPAEIVSADRKTVALNVLRIESPRRELPFRLVIAVALPKGDRGDVLIEKLTELGATDVVPLKTERSVVHPRETKLDRLQRSVIEASKQCGRNVLMQIHPLIDWSDFCTRADLPTRKLLADTAAQEPPTIQSEDVCVAIGPEGGFTVDERHRALASGWQPVSLGPRVLRVETAALALAVLVAIGFRAS